MYRWSAWINLFIVLFLSPSLLIAIPYVPPEELNRRFQERSSFSAGIEYPPQPFELDELDDYPNTIEMVRILDWLTTMQVDEPGLDFGGMREGENQDMDIIQTDNTQEALRDWAHFAGISGDLERYEENIAAAWEYTMNWPAYSEEGGGNPNYYRVHNCGWGLVAVMEYTDAYGDSTFLTYGDSCAAYIDSFRLNLEGDVINPLSQGFGAGCLYLYGAWRDSSDWMDAGQEIANDIQLWIEADPDRLNNWETWAMSGGTAMWGVVTALFLDDHEAGQEWLPDYIDFMDTYSGPGQWNNSWTIWYGHAWHVINQVLDTDETLENAYEVVNYMLDQGALDVDAGIPATEDLFDRDQSWTSAYTVWYGLEPIIELHTEQFDAAPVQVVSPNPALPLRDGDPVTFQIDVANAGLMYIEDVAVSVSINEYTGHDTVSLSFFEQATVTFEPEWMADIAGEFQPVFVVNHENDTNPDNDTLYADFSVWPASFISGEITDAESGDPVNSHIDFYLYEINPDSIYYSTDCLPETGQYSQDVVTGTYRLEITPNLPPFTPRTIDSLTVVEGGAENVDLELNAAPLMLIAEDTSGYESWYLESLEAIEIDTYPWLVYERGYPEDTLFSVDVAIWSTGDYVDDIFPTTNWTEINLFLEGGGSMLVTGQGMQNKWGGFTILRNRFGSEEGELDMSGPLYYQLSGIEEAPVSHGDSSAIISPVNMGANNQDAVDEVIPFNGGVPIFHYGNTGQVAAVAFEDPDEGYKTVFCGFGVEAMPSLSPVYMSREQFLRRVLVWFGTIESPVIEHPVSIPEAFAIDTWPNPFNSTLSIKVTVPQPGEFRLKIYDLLGREVKRWTSDQIQPGYHQFFWNAEIYSSGVYFLNVESSGYSTENRKIILLK